MAENQPDSDVFPNLSVVREIYRMFLRFVLANSPFNPNDPMQLERCLAEQQGYFFAPLIEGLPNDKFLDFCKFADIKPSLLSSVQQILKKASPTLVGCHYRSVGLEQLRQSVYLPTPRFSAKVEQHFGKSDHLKTFAQDESIKLLRDAKDTKRLERFFSRYLQTYFWLFGRHKTLNEQVFNTSDPLGPIGLVFTGAMRGSWLSIHNLLPDLVRILKAPIESTAFAEIWRLVFTHYGKVSPGVYDGIKKDLATARQSSIDIIERENAKWDTVCDFFTEHLPYCALGSGDRNDDILTLLQAYLLYEPFSGPCVYTFPACAQPNLPSCAWTLMTETPVEHEGCLEYCQRLSELVYGLFGQEVSRAYRTQFYSNKGQAWNELRHLLRITDHKNSADLVLASCLSESPIPLEAVKTFMDFVMHLPHLSVYEGKEYGFFFMLAHQEYLERLGGIIPSLKKEYEPGVYTDPPDRKPPWDAVDLVSGDPLRVEMACHGMRSYIQERKYPDHIQLCVYKPVNPDTVDVNTLEKAREFIGDQEADKSVIFLMGNSVHVSNLNDLVHAYYYRQQLGQPPTPITVEDYAEALTFGNKEILIVIYEPDFTMKLYHDGSLILVSDHLQWELPQMGAGEFSAALKKRIEIFLGKQQITSDEKITTMLTNQMVKLFSRISRQKKGALFVFHPGDRPDGWCSTDTAAGDAPETKANWLAFLQQGTQHDSFWKHIEQFSAVDGAVVFLKDGIILNKIRIVLQLDLNASKDMPKIKAAQTWLDYPWLRSCGTKHSAAYEYALTTDSGFAVTVSADGPVTLFFPEVIDLQKKNKIKEWLKEFRNVPEITHNKSVRIIRL